MTRVIAIDPGTEQSGIAIWDGQRVCTADTLSNEYLLIYLLDMTRGSHDVLAIEMIASYGMPVGREVFQTCVWIGRFQQAWWKPADARLVVRQDVKLHWCHSVRAKDPNIWKAILDRFGPVGTKRAPGLLYGVKSHARAALALAVMVSDGLDAEPMKGAA